MWATVCERDIIKVGEKLDEKTFAPYSHTYRSTFRKERGRNSIQPIRNL